MSRRLRINVWGALLLSLLMAAAPADAPVADAAQRGDTDSVRALLRQGADVNAAQPDGMSALHWAAMNGNTSMVEVLLYAGANTEATTRLGGYTALHLAAKAGNGDVIDHLLETGADPMVTTTTGTTALHYAAASGVAAAVATLIGHGSDVDAREGSADQTPLMWATAANRIDAMKALLDGGADVSLASRVIDYAARARFDRPARERRQALVIAQRAADAPIELPSENTAEEEEAPEVILEVEEPEEEAEEADDDVQHEVDEDESPEHDEDDADHEGEEDEATALEDQDEEAEEAAAAEATDEEAEDDEEEEPQGGVGPPGSQPQGGGDRPLSYEQLVGLEGGFTALHFASRDGFADAAKLLLDYGADLSQGSADGTSPMLMSIINGNFDLAMHFLGEGADPNQVSEDGAAPLFTVLNRRWAPKAGYPQPSAFRQQETGYMDLMGALIDKGADVNHQAGRHVWYTSFNFDMLGVKFGGATAFWRAAYATDVPAMQMLVAAGADPSLATKKVPSFRYVFRPSGVSQEDKSGLPELPIGGPAVYPIHAASGVGYGEGFASNQHSHAPNSWLPAVQYLVEELGADVNARDLNGYSPVHHAAARGDNQLIMYLVSKGADVTVVSRRGETTVDMANGPRQRIEPFPETIALLEGLGAINNHNCQSC